MPDLWLEAPRRQVPQQAHDHEAVAACRLAQAPRRDQGQNDLRVRVENGRPLLETYSDHDGGWRLEADGDGVDETLRALLGFLEKYERPQA